MIATKPANEDESEAKLRWAFRMYDTDSSGEYLTTMNALLMLHNVLTPGHFFYLGYILVP